MLVSILVWVFAVLITRRAFRIGKKVDQKGFRLYLFGLSLALGIAGIAGVAVDNSRHSTEELAAHGLQRCVGFFVLSLPLSAVGWLIGRMNRPSQVASSPDLDKADAEFDQIDEFLPTQPEIEISRTQIVRKHRIEDQTRSLVLDEVHEHPKVPSPPSLFWVTTDKAQIGPIPRSEVLRQLAEGKFSLDDFCWSGGMSDWNKIGEVFPEVERNGKPG